jgi:hypothetical protein
MHRLIVILLVIIASNQFSFGKDIILTKIASNLLHQQMQNDWQLDNSSGISIWIARKWEMNEGLRLLIYIEPKNYNLENLKKVFASLNRENANARYLSVRAETSKNAVRENMMREVIPSKNAPPDSLRSKEKEDLSAINEESYSASYFRAKDTERFLYYNPKNGYLQLIDLKKKPLQKRKSAKRKV